MLLYHGPGAWKGPTELDEVFPRGIPRNFLPIFGDPERGRSSRSGELMGAMTALDRDTSVVGTMVALGTLRRIAAETGGRVGWLLVKCVGAWLVSKERITEEQYREATTMTQVMTAYERSLEEWAREKYAKEREQERAEGRAEGRRAERAEVLCRQAGHRFGAAAGDRLADLFGTSPDTGRLTKAEAAVIECATADELMRRVRG